MSKPGSNIISFRMIVHERPSAATLKRHVNIYEIYYTLLPDVAQDEAVSLEDHVPKMDPGKARPPRGFCPILHRVGTQVDFN